MASVLNNIGGDTNSLPANADEIYRSFVTAPDQ